MGEKLRPDQLTIVADLGNTRLKWGWIGAGGEVEGVSAVELARGASWVEGLDESLPAEGPGQLVVASVNPPKLEELLKWLKKRGGWRARAIESAAQVPVRNELETLQTTGADRALGVMAAISRANGRGPGLVVLCGTAATVERISALGVWEGGAIMPGLGMSARCLSERAAQLPLVVPSGTEVVAAWGRQTQSALAAGLFWGFVGGLRELMERQSEGFSQQPWVCLSGGDAPRVARQFAGAHVKVRPNLVLEGLARLAILDSANTHDG